MGTSVQRTRRCKARHRMQPSESQAQGWEGGRTAAAGATRRSAGSCSMESAAAGATRLGERRSAT
eukprot:7381406-Prymnesium_polylepis.1